MQEDVARKIVNSVTTNYYHSIPGWFDFEDIYLSAISDANQGGSYFVEVGALFGKSSYFMALEIFKSGKKIQFDVIDNWKGTSYCKEEKKLIKLSGCTTRNLFKIFKQNIEKGGMTDYINSVKMNSLEAAKQYEDNSLNFVFLDANYRYNEILADIKYWWPKVKQFGTIAGHDFNNSTDVQKAVHEVFGDDFAVVGNSWVVVKCNLDNEIQFPVITATLGKDIDKLNKCCKALDENTNDFKHFIIYNGKDDDVFEKINMMSSKNRIVFKHSINNLGAINRNIILKNTKSEFVAIVDDDVYVCPNWLEKSIDAFSNRNIAMVAILTKNKNKIFHADILFDGFNVYSVDYKKDINDIELVDKIIEKCALLTTACCVMRSSMVKKIGCLSNEFAPVLFEDYDFCLKFYEKGYDLFLIQSIQCEHEFETTTKDMRDVMTINAKKFKDKWHWVYKENGLAHYVLNKTSFACYDL